MGGRGVLPSTIPAVSVAMDQLMKQLPAGWFFPRKKASDLGWRNRVAKAMDPETAIKQLRDATEKLTRHNEGLKDVTKRIMKHLDPDGPEDDQCPEEPT